MLQLSASGERDNRCGPQARYWEYTMTNMTRLCKDCRWAALEEKETGMVWRCAYPRSKFVPPPDYVTGKPVKPRQ
jgi:hypothetical protein